MPAKMPSAPPEPASAVPPAVHLARPGDMQGFALHMPDAADIKRSAAIVAREALRWTYVLRSRRRWVGDSRARERNEEDAQRAMEAIGVKEDRLAALAKDDVAVVRVPWTGKEAMHWESRIFPWEYVLAAATRRHRLAGSRDARPKPLTVMRELVLDTPATPPPPDPRTLFANGLRLLFVECLPSELRERWNLGPELGRLSAALAGLDGVEVRQLAWPTLAELCKAVKDWQPQFIHFAGLDSHQGLRELRDQLGVDALVDLGPPRACPAAGGSASPDLPLPHGLQPVALVTADSRLMVDGLLFRGESQAKPDARAAAPGVAEASGTREAPVPRSFPQLVPAHDLACALRDGGHCAWLVTFNVWNSAARLAPLVVGERAALSSLGFQDVFDDSLAEFIHGLLMEKLRASDWNLPAAFQHMWREVRLLPESVDATGITLWAGAPLLGTPAAPAAAVATPARAVGARAAPAAQPHPTATGRSEAPQVSVEVKPFAELNYAVLHNAQPMFEKFVLETDTPDARPVLDIEVAVHMGAETARYRRRLTMSRRRISLTRDVHVPLTAAIARAAREAIGSSIEVEVSQDGRTLYRESHRLRLLPVDQWRDNRRDGRWLPSFVQPRDPAVASAMEQAQRYVRVLRDDPNAGFEGYQLARAGDEESLRGVDRQVEAIWATLLHDWKLGYINPPPTYSGTLDSQRLRLPSSVLRHRAGTCIDLALLFAACLELIDIYPVIFLLEGHALPGWWRHADYRAEYVEMPRESYSDLAALSATENLLANAQIVSWHTGKASWPEIRRWIRQRKLVPIETVRLTENCGFVEAIESGVEALSERRDFDSMLDVVTARTANVTPLPVREELA